jgi:uncharacterized damage-inducible protein DinB
MQAETQMDPIIQTAFGDLAHEMASTRRMIAAVPDDKFDWQPHTRSQSLGSLATHIVQMSGWARMILTETEFDFLKPRPAEEKLTTTSALLKQLDANAADLAALLATLTAKDLEANWALRAGDHVIMSAPRSNVLRTLYMSHIVHHRGQLSIYLRMLDVPMPGMYGPSADER